MVINESGLCAAMKDAFRKKSTGYKVAARLNKDEEEEIILSAPGWMAIITRENAPRKVLALIVEHMGDLPKVGQAFQIQDKNAQSTISDMAVAELPKNAGKAMVQRTQISYMNHQIYQRTDNDEVFMVSPKVEALLASTLLPLSVADKGMFCAAGIASTLFISPADVMQNEMTALHHLAKLKWV